MTSGGSPPSTYPPSTGQGGAARSQPMEWEPAGERGGGGKWEVRGEAQRRRGIKVNGGWQRPGKKKGDQKLEEGGSLN